MGTNYVQQCILGISINAESIKNIISEEQYRDEPRYDTRTGKQVKTERVLIKGEVYNYVVLGKVFDEPEYIQFDDLDVAYDFNSETVYIGEKTGEYEDYGRVDLLIGSISLDEILEKSRDLSKRLKVDVKEIGIHFIARVG